MCKGSSPSSQTSRSGPFFRTINLVNIYITLLDYLVRVIVSFAEFHDNDDDANTQIKNAFVECVSQIWTSLINLVKLGDGGLVIGSSQFLLLPQKRRSLQKWPKARLVSLNP